jgi:hypothetical protein
MKKTIFILSAILLASFSFAQMPDKFVKAMEANIAELIQLNLLRIGWILPQLLKE